MRIAMAFEDIQRGRTNYEWLVAWLDEMDYPDTAALRRELRVNRGRYMRWMGKSHQMCVKVEHAAELFQTARECDCPPQDPGLARVAAQLLYVLLVEYEASGAGADVLDAMEEAHESCLCGSLQNSAEQVEALCQVLREARDAISALAGQNGRVVLIHLPIGNSLPVQTLAWLLRRNHRVRMVDVSLPRQNAARRAALAENLHLEDLAGSDVVVLFDEWNSGVNFATVCKVVAGLVPPGLHFLPIAVRSVGSAGNPDYAHYCRRHDRLVAKCGLVGTDFRRELPPIPSEMNNEGYFFWAEDDRMAGYRKMQVPGLIFSSFDEAVETLHTNWRALQRTAHFIAHAMAPGLGMPEMVALVQECRQQFAAAYLDYQACKKQLEIVGRNEAKGGLVADFEPHLGRVLAGYNAIVAGRDAQLAIDFAQVYLSTQSGLDPGDRYHFHDHAPILVGLRGRPRITHKIVMGYLRETIEEMDENN